MKNILAYMAMARHLGHETTVEMLNHSPSDSPPTTVTATIYQQLPKPAQMQIFGLAIDKLQQLEATILQELDGLLFETPSIRARELTLSLTDPLILGLCIRRMALWYRQMMFKYKHHGGGKYLPIYTVYLAGRVLLIS